MEWIDKLTVQRSIFKFTIFILIAAICIFGNSILLMSNTFNKSKMFFVIADRNNTLISLMKL